MSTDTAIQLELEDQVREVVAVAEGRKAIDLKVLELEAVSDVTSYFLICSGNTQRQVQAIAEAVKSSLKSSGVQPLHMEGYRHGQWVLLDYGDFVLHVFSAQSRKYYSLERLWADAPDITDQFQ